MTTSEYHHNIIGINERKHPEMTEFPIIDAQRHEDDADGRIVLAKLDMLEPRTPEDDWWCRLPLRLAHDAGSGLVLEIGPYTLDEHDVRRLREALAAYDLAHRGPVNPLRRAFEQLFERRRLR